MGAVSLRIHTLSKNQCFQEGMAPLIIFIPNIPLYRVLISMSTISFLKFGGLGF